MSPIWFNEAVLDKIYGEYFSYAAPIANMGNLRERERERACTAKFCLGPHEVDVGKWVYIIALAKVANVKDKQKVRKKMNCKSSIWCEF